MLSSRVPVCPVRYGFHLTIAYRRNVIKFTNVPWYRCDGEASNGSVAVQSSATSLHFPGGTTRITSCSAIQAYTWVHSMWGSRLRDPNGAPLHARRSFSPLHARGIFLGLNGPPLGGYPGIRDPATLHVTGIIPRTRSPPLGLDPYNTYQI